MLWLCAYSMAGAESDGLFGRVSGAEALTWTLPFFAADVHMCPLARFGLASVLRRIPACLRRATPRQAGTHGMRPGPCGPAARLPRLRAQARGLNLVVLPCSPSAGANVRVSSRQRRAGRGQKKLSNPSPTACTMIYISDAFPARIVIWAAFPLQRGMGFYYAHPRPACRVAAQKSREAQSCLLYTSPSPRDS